MIKKADYPLIKPYNLETTFMVKLIKNILENTEDNKIKQIDNLC